MKNESMAYDNGKGNRSPRSAVDAVTGDYRPALPSYSYFLKQTISQKRY